METVLSKFILQTAFLSKSKCAPIWILPSILGWPSYHHRSQTTELHLKPLNWLKPQHSLWFLETNLLSNWVKQTSKWKHSLTLNYFASSHHRDSHALCDGYWTKTNKLCSLYSNGLTFILTTSVVSTEKEKWQIDFMQNIIKIW